MIRRGLVKTDALNSVKIEFKELLNLIRNEKADFLSVATFDESVLKEHIANTCKLYIDGNIKEDQIVEVFQDLDLNNEHEIHLVLILRVLQDAKNEAKEEGADEEGEEEEDVEDVDEEQEGEEENSESNTKISTLIHSVGYSDRFLAFVVKMCFKYMPTFTLWTQKTSEFLVWLWHAFWDGLAEVGRALNPTEVLVLVVNAIIERNLFTKVILGILLTPVSLGLRISLIIVWVLSWVTNPWKKLFGKLKDTLKWGEGEQPSEGDEGVPAIPE